MGTHERDHSSEWPSVLRDLHRQLQTCSGWRGGRRRQYRCDYNADGTNYDRPIHRRWQHQDRTLPIRLFERDLYLRRTAFCGSIFPSPGLTEGNLGRNTFHGPGFANTDFSVIKNVKIPWFIGGEGANLQFGRSSQRIQSRKPYPSWH